LLAFASPSLALTLPAPCIGAREAFLPPTAKIHSNFYSDRDRNNGLLFNNDDDIANGDDHMLAHTYSTRGYDCLPEERDEVKAERNRRAGARRDVVTVEKARADADVTRSRFHEAEEKVASQLKCYKPN
jgi:hypothetical protein